MIKLAILIAVSAIAQQACCDEPERIVGGDIAAIGQFKYQVSLQSYGEHICGGSIISSTHILTAAHCVDDDFYTDDMLIKLFNLQIVVSGTNSPRIGGEKHDIKCIRKHPQYTGEKEGGWKDDIAVITLKKPIKANDVQGPIPLASKNYINGGKRGIVSGWGRTKISGSSSEILRWLSVNVLSQESCLHGHKNPRTNENQICTLEKIGKGACQGDSGGPLVVDGEVVGVVSWVLPCALGKSDVFTNVYNYLDFIEESQSMC
ncbi:chymotrypsin-1 [Lasius niger]|uniref:Chymotrypsin-1 n=1 Tax=Lasius niger TaxID=67767 RepID=A0A0J7KRT3_LASNI|nr:chymotrypsin-1 [Lasius niger]